MQREKERRTAEEKRIQEGSRLRKQREQLTAELNEVKAQLIKRQSLEEMKALVASYNVIVLLLVYGRCADNLHRIGWKFISRRYLE